MLVGIRQLAVCYIFTFGDVKHGEYLFSSAHLGNKLVGTRCGGYGLHYKVFCSHFL